MAKNLRKTLSKSRVSQQKPAETEKMNNDNDLGIASKIANTEPSSEEVDPLKFFEKPLSSIQVNPLKFLDIIQSTPQEKRETENELIKEKEFKEQTGFKDIGQINKNRLTMVQSNRMRTDNKPMKIIDPQDSQKDEAILRRFTKQSEKITEPKVIPGKIDKISSNEMDEKQKQHLIERMSSAKQNMSKIAFGKALIKKSSESILEKAKNLEGKIQFNPLNQDSHPKYVIMDSDVQIINEITNDNSNNNNNTNNIFKPIKDVDIESIMKGNNKNDVQQKQPQQQQQSNAPKKEVKSIADLILKRPALTGKKKGANPVFDPDKKE